MSVTFDKELKVGIFTIVSLVLLYLGINFLSGVDFFSSTNHYYAVYPNVEGLTESNPVKYKGVEVGNVGKITLMEPQGVLVVLNINKQVRLRKGADATLMTSLTGTSSVILKNVSESAPLLHSGDTLTGITPKSLSDILESTATPLVSKLDSVLNDFKGAGTVMKQTMLRYDTTSQRINELLANNQEQIHRLLGNLNMLSRNLNGLTHELQPTLKNFHAISDSLAQGNYKQMAKDLGTSLTNLNGILEVIKRGEGTMGKLLTNDSLYNNINQSMQSLDSLLIDLKANPKRYVHFSLFGKKDKKK
ncbi:MAG: MlaD family protein [Cytophagales bacterium]|nr:MlaD family protein [Cytophagales bacterium]